MLQTNANPKNAAIYFLGSIMEGVVIAAGLYVLSPNKSFTDDTNYSHRDKSKIEEHVIQFTWMRITKDQVYSVNGRAPYYVDEPPYGSLDFVVHQERTESMEDMAMNQLPSDYSLPTEADRQVFLRYYAQWKFKTSK